MLNEKLHEIYKIHHPDGRVIPGGVMNEGKYLLSKIKMMMLMKEVNDSSDKYNWSLPSLLLSIYERKEGGPVYYRMWKNVSRWAICSQLPDITFEEINEEHLYEGLKLFATTNLKKTSGTGKSDYHEISNHARQNKEEWMQEIEILDPTIVVCSGTFDIVKDIMNVNEYVQVCKSGARYFTLNKRLYLDFVHPAYQVSDKLMFAYFKETYRNLLEQDCFCV